MNNCTTLKYKVQQETAESNLLQQMLRISLENKPKTTKTSQDEKQITNTWHTLGKERIKHPKSQIKGIRPTETEVFTEHIDGWQDCTLLW